MDSLTFESIKRDQFDLKKGYDHIIWPMTVISTPYSPYHSLFCFVHRSAVSFVVFVVANHEKELEV